MNVTVSPNEPIARRSRSVGSPGVQGIAAPGAHWDPEPRVEQARGLLAEVNVHANPLAGDLVARGGVFGLVLACLRQHLVDLPVRDHDSA